MKKLLCMVLILSLVISSVAVVNADTAINFKDLIKFGKKNWAYDTIIKLANDKVIAGFPDGTYRPDASITREEFVKLLVDALKLEKVNRVSFDDINGIWSQIYIETTVKEGIVIPSEVGKNFRPKDSITRNEMAYMMGRALRLEPFKVWVPERYPYIDNRDQLVNRLYTEYLMYGTVKSDNYRYFDGNRDMTRAEAAVIIDRVMQYSQDETAYKAAKEKELIDSLVKATPDLEFEKFVNSPEARKYVSNDYFKAENGLITFKEYATWDNGDMILNSTKYKELNKVVYNTVKELTKLARRDDGYLAVFFNPNTTTIIIRYNSKGGEGTLGTDNSAITVSVQLTPYNDDPLHKDIYLWWDIKTLWNVSDYSLNSLEDLAKINYTQPIYTDALYAAMVNFYGETDGKAIYDYTVKECRLEYTNPLAQARINKSAIKINGINIGNYNDKGGNICFVTNIKKK